MGFRAQNHAARSRPVVVANTSDEWWRKGYVLHDVLSLPINDQLVYVKAARGSYVEKRGLRLCEQHLAMRYLGNALRFNERIRVPQYPLLFVGRQTVASVSLDGGKRLLSCGDGERRSKLLEGVRASISASPRIVRTICDDIAERNLLISPPMVLQAGELGSSIKPGGQKHGSCLRNMPKQL